MKKLLILIALVFCIGADAQEKSVFIEEGLQSAVIEFLNEARARGFDPVDKIIALDSIVFTTDNRFLGLAANNNVYINNYLSIDPHIVKVVMAHELLHALYNIKHCHNTCYHLMGATKPPEFTFSFYYDKQIWKEVLDIEFKRIKQ